MSTIAHIPQLVVHGDKDPTVSVERSRVMVKAAQAANVQIKYLEIPGGNHSDVVVPTLKDVFDWFDAHERQPRGVAKPAAAGGQK